MIQFSDFKQSWGWRSDCLRASWAHPFVTLCCGSLSVCLGVCMGLLGTLFFENQAYAQLLTDVLPDSQEQASLNDLDESDVVRAGLRTEFINTNKWPDTSGVHINAHGGGFLFHQGVYYWFGEHKIAGRGGNRAMVGVHVYQSKDLYNWDDAGIALEVVDDPNHEITRGCVLERPKVVYNEKTNKFVMWFHLEYKDYGYEAARTAVATSDHVTGPYTFIRSYRPNAGIWPENFTLKQRRRPTRQEREQGWPSHENFVDGDWLRQDFPVGQMARDMTIFIDDDGKGYHIYSSEENRTLHIAELTEDFTDFTGKYVRALPAGANEAPAIFKHEGKYWMLSSGLTGWDPNPARASVAPSIWGPWRYVNNPCVGQDPETGAGANITFGGQSTYILPVQGKKDAFIAMFDVWRPRNPIDGFYIWLPVTFEKGRMVIRYHKKWDLSIFEDETP